MATKQLNIKNKTYYFYNDLINLSNFSASNLKIDKKSWKNIDIYYIAYVDKDKPKEWEVHSVNPLYLIVNKVFCFVGQTDGVKYLKIDKIENLSDSDGLTIWNQVFFTIKYHIDNISNEKVNFDSHFDKIKFVSNDYLPLGKLIYFPTLTVVIRCVFKQDEIYYPQVYLNDALDQL